MGLRGHSAVEEQAALGVIVEQTWPVKELVWRLVPPALLAESFNITTLEEWVLQLAETEEALAAGEIDSPLPSSMVYGDWISLHNEINLAEALNNLYESATAYLHDTGKRQQQGGMRPNPEQAVSPILTEISNRLARRIEIIEDTPMLVIARIEDVGLVANIRDYSPKQTLEAAKHLQNLQMDNEQLTVCAKTDLEYAKEAIRKIIADLNIMGVAGIFDHDGEEIYRKFEKMTRRRGR